jgi:Uma2 family endonuclease
MSVMSTQALHRLNAEEYLRAEAGGEVRHEFVRGQVFDMVGGTDTHNLISLNIASALRERLRGKSCRVFMADMKVRIAAADVFYYPDVFVTCVSSDRKPYFKEHPCLIVEVLSETTEGTDRREKFLAYELLESLREYVLVQQSRREVEVFGRDAAKGPWTKSTHSDDEKIDLASLGLSLTLSQIYEGLGLP